MTLIIVTGTPATGKTTLSKELANLKNFEYVNLNDFSKKNGLVIEFDKKRDCEVIDEEKLTEKIKEYSKGKNIVLDSHLSHFVDKEIVDICIVTKCDLKELKKRLELRNYSESKIRENLDSEIFDTCNIEAQEEGHKPIIIQTDKDIKQQLKKNNLI